MSSRWFHLIIEFIYKNKIFYFILFSSILRIPHFLRADYRLDSDGAHHWIVIDYILTGKSVALHPYGLTHLGITDFILSIPFSLLLGHTQYSYQLMLHLVFLLLSFSIYKITQFAYGQKASDYSLLLLALPNPILYHFLVRPYGGHLLGSVIVILSLLLLFVSEKKENKIPYLCLSSFLVSFAYYTSHLSIIPLLPLCGYIAIYLIKERSIKFFIFSFVSFLIGIIPITLGRKLQPYPDTYMNSSFSIELSRILNNFLYSIKYIFPAILDLFFLPGMEESGFIPSKDLRNLFPIVNFLFLFTFIYAGVKVFSLESLKINGNYSLFASLVILLNTLAILVTSNGLEGFGVRFFIPAILISLPLYSLIFAGEYRGVKIAWLNEKFRYFLLFLHFSIYVISYGRGYLNFNSGLYTFEATPGIKQIVAVLKENQVQYCATDYWISNPIIYETNFAILASTVRNLTSGPIRNPEIENVIINNPKGIQCIINNWFSPISNNSKKPSEFIENDHYSFRILKTLEVERNKIFIVEQFSK